jgi:superfamily II helicase
VIANKARFHSSKKLEKITGIRIPGFAFNGAFLEIVSSQVNFEYLDRGLRNRLLNFFRDFINCNCRDSPFCGCPERKFAMMLIELREMGLDHRQISDHLLEEYDIEIFPADVLSYLEDSVHVLEAIRDVAELQGEEEMMRMAKENIKDIEG